MKRTTLWLYLALLTAPCIPVQSKEPIATVILDAEQLKEYAPYGIGIACTATFIYLFLKESEYTALDLCAQRLTEFLHHYQQEIALIERLHVTEDQDTVTRTALEKQILQAAYSSMDELRTPLASYIDTLNQAIDDCIYDQTCVDAAGFFFAKRQDHWGSLYQFYQDQCKPLVQKLKALRGILLSTPAFYKERIAARS